MVLAYVIMLLPYDSDLIRLSLNNPDQRFEGYLTDIEPQFHLLNHNELRPNVEEGILLSK